ncbi:AraC family transcriptional regulator [Williamsia sp. MIQD14]|uniref:AraC family transcriptional regulator n=1 Tax=Williamsia sp. MIQD14 TaxID=3425703 RepID=UPI003DA11700
MTRPTDDAPWTVLRSAPGSQLLLDFAAEHGIAEREMLSGTGIAPGTVITSITAEQELAMLETLADRLDTVEGLGALLGQRYHLTTYGLWGFAMISSATLREAIAVGLRLVNLTFAFCRIGLRDADADGLAAMVLSVEGGVPDTVRRIVCDRDIAAIRVIAHEIMGRELFAEAVTSTFPEPTDTSAYEAAFGVTPRFGAIENAIWFRAALLDLPLPQANALVAAEIGDQCRQLLQERRVRMGTAARVRDLVSAAPSDPLTLARAARELHTSERHLRRQLAHEGTTLRRIVNEVREDMADELLCVTGLSVAETARRLGYAEVSSFSQAFRRWKGMGPREYRRQRSSAAPPVGVSVR